MAPTPEVQREKSPRSRARVVDRLRNDSAFRRRIFLSTTGAAVAVTTLITVILTVLTLTSSANTADRLAAAGDVLVGATLLLAAIAALVALLAYAVSTGTPDLQLSVCFDNSSPNNPAFENQIQHRDPPEVYKAVTWTPNLGKILLRNNSGYSAKNPAVIVRLHGMFFIPSDPVSFEREWASMEVADTGRWGVLLDDVKDKVWIMAVQWDGGPTYSIHGHSTRRLPDLQFSNLWYIPLWGAPTLTFEILAEGYRREITIPVDFDVAVKAVFPTEDEKTNPEWM